MHSLTPSYLDKISFSARQASTIQVIGQYLGKQQLYMQQTPQILEELRTAAMIESVVSSNRLEGITAPPDRIDALMLRPTAAVGRSEEEIAGYRDALEELHGQSKQFPINENTLLHFHDMINRYTGQLGGRWKRHDNVILEQYADGTERVRFRPVPVAETPSAIAQFVKAYETAVHHDRREPLVVIPLAILDFLCIHPFDDGNGRCSRLLMLLLLYHFGYEVGRYISLERIIEQSKLTYYEALEASSRNWHQGQHDPHPWLNYSWGVLIAAYKEFADRVGTIQTARGSKTERVRSAVLRRFGEFAISDIERDCPTVSRDMIRVVLNQMRDEGLVVLHGKGRGAKWEKKRRVERQVESE